MDEVLTNAAVLFTLWVAVILAAKFGYYLIERIEHSIDEWLR